MNRPPFLRPALAAVACAAALAGAVPAMANEAAIRKNLSERFPQLPKIDEVTRSAVPGLWEVRFAGTEIVYTDSEGRFLIQGEVIDTRTMTNLTQERIDKITAIDFASLPLKDALVFKQGSGARKLAVFADPNCGYCKRFERDLLTIKDVTVYTFLLPILGADSTNKARDIWCAKDGAKAWRDWMIDNVVPTKVTGKCDDDALERNVALSRKHRINGTPALLFENGVRKPGALPAAEVERLLVAAGRKP